LPLAKKCQSIDYAPAAKNVLLIQLIPDGKKCFIDRLCRWRQKGYKRVTPLGSFIFADLTPEGSHVSSYLVSGGIIFFYCTVWSLAESFPNCTIWSLAAKYYFNLSIRKGDPFYIRFQNFLKIQCIPL